MITEIFVEGKRIDINADISSLLTFAIDDVKDFSSRQTSFSKTVVIPGTGNNNAIFGNIFELGSSNDYDPLVNNIGYNFNAAKSARCVIFQDNLQTFKGTLRLLEIDKDRGRIEYEVALNGDLTTLNVALSSGYISDLDFSAYDTVYNSGNIVASWDHTPGAGVYWPLIDYGTYSAAKHDWNIRTFRPALYVKEFIDKMFSFAGFRYQCDLFNTERFRRLINPCNKKTLTKKSTYYLDVARNAPYSTAITEGFNEEIHFDTLTTLGDFVSVGGYGNSIFQYTAAAPVTDVLTFYFTITYSKSDAANDGGTLSFDTASGPIASIPLPNGYSSPQTLSGSIQVPAFVITTGQAIGVMIDYPDATGTGTAVLSVTITSARLTYGSGSGSTIVPVNPGEVIPINDNLPQNIKHIDYLVSIVKLFNLYVYEDRFDDRLIKITPFIDFYESGSGGSVDWTYKLNRDEPIKIKPLSELNSKIYNFNYKDDSDYYNDLYKKRYNLGYGSYVFDSEFEFASETNKLELIFASTPLLGYIGEEKVYPTIFKRTGAVIGAGEETIDSVIRIMQTKKITGVTSWDITGGPTLVSLTSYGYAGHFDDPDAPSNDLNFGALSELFFALSAGNLSNTQFNVYWSGYMAEITDKDSKMLTAKFYLTPKDIFELDFGKYVYVDGVLFRLNKITDYNATIPSDCDVQLLKVIQTSYSFPPAIPPDDLFLLWSDGDVLLFKDTEEILYD